MKKLGLIACIAAPVAAVATPPWFVDWAHTAAYRKLAVRTYYVSNQVGTTRTQSLPMMQFATGVTPNLELNFKFGDILKITSATHEQAFGDTTVGMKYRFFQNKRDTEVGLGYAYNLRTAGLGLGTNANGQTPYLMASVTPGRFGFYTVLGQTYPDNYALHTDTYYGLLSTYNLTGKLMLGAEVYGNTATKEGAKNDAEYAGGFYYQDNDVTRWFAKFGHSMEGYSDLNFTLGVQIVFETHDINK